MSSLIITSGNTKYFSQLKNFVNSLRLQGEYSGPIAMCDNVISGTWDNPGTWDESISFSQEELDFFERNNVKIYPLASLLRDNNIDSNVIKNIKSPTQRYPYKFIYNTLISKKFLGKIDSIFYFDSDVYFQTSVSPLLNEFYAGKVTIVKEWRTMKKNFYLNKWLKYSDFSSVSSQESYLASMLPAPNFCSGFYGSDVNTFHRFNLLAMLLSSNQFVDFYSDQPLVNILKTFFGYPFKEIGFEYCLHLGELESGSYKIVNHQFEYKKVIPICVHFNGGKYQELETALLNNNQPEYSNASNLQKIFGKILSLLKFYLT